MKAAARILLIFVWYGASWTLDCLAYYLALFDWTQIGWAFGSSTVYIVWETIQGATKRSPAQRMGVVFISMFIAMSPVCQWAVRKWELDKNVTTTLLGLFSFLLFNFMAGKIQKAKTMKDITDLTP